MRDRLDPLIGERAPWLQREDMPTRATRKVLDRVLGYDKTIAIGELIRDLPTQDVMATMGAMLAQDVEASGLSNIPRQGPALIVANHPTGIADGIMLHHVLKTIRPDAFYYANSDILRVLPQMSDTIVPVEWRTDKRSHAKTRATMALTRDFLSQGRLGVIFPAGRLAKRRGLKLYERDWMPSAAMIARKFDLSVIPLNIRARNSALFYLFDRIHPTLRDITLFYETLNKNRQAFRIRAGEAISPTALPHRSDQAIAILKAATLELGGRHAPNVSLVDRALRPRWVRALSPG